MRTVKQKQGIWAITLVMAVLIAPLGYGQDEAPAGDPASARPASSAEPTKEGAEPSAEPALEDVAPSEGMVEVVVEDPGEEASEPSAEATEPGWMKRHSPGR